MGNPKTYHFKLPPYQGTPIPEPPNSWYPGVQPHWTPSTSDRMARGDGNIRAFVIHATAGGSSSGAMSVMFAHKASWHWLIPDEDEPEHGTKIWACAPEKRAAWHVRNDRSHSEVNSGSRFVNYWSLGVEIVNTQQGDPFSDWQVEQTAALVRYAWSKYPTLVDVVSHAKLDPQRRNDPGDNFPWDRFRDLVLAPSDESSVPVEPTSPASQIRIVGPNGKKIDCDASIKDGVTVAEVRPLVEALGFKVEYSDGPPMTMKIQTVKNVTAAKAPASTKKSTKSRKAK